MRVGLSATCLNDRSFVKTYGVCMAKKSLSATYLNDSSFEIHDQKQEYLSATLITKYKRCAEIIRIDPCK